MTTPIQPGRPWQRLSRFALVPLALGAVGIGALVACGGDDDDDVPTIILDNTPDASETGGEGDGASATPDDSPTDADSTPGDGETSFRGGKVEPPFEKPALVLTDDEGQPFDLVADTDGFVTLFYVGYTHCPDICPTHMATVAAALQQLDQETRDRIKVVFATADPARDTPEVLDAYLEQFDPSFIGVTGTQEEMDEVQRTVGILPPEGTLGEPDAEGNYEVAHAAFVIAYDQEDELGHLVYPAGIPLDVWVNDLNKLVTDGYEPS